MIVHPEQYDPPGAIDCGGCPRLREKWRRHPTGCPNCPRAEGADDDNDEGQTDE